MFEEDMFQNVVFLPINYAPQRINIADVFLPIHIIVFQCMYIHIEIEKGLFRWGNISGIYPWQQVCRFVALLDSHTATAEQP